MQNLLRSFSLIFFLFFATIKFVQMSAQCPGAATCEEAYVFCSLDEMEGFSCNNAGGSEFSCGPSCLSNKNCHHGTKCRVSWWAFTSQGGNVSISLSYGVCSDIDADSDLDGLVWGISGDCQCIEELLCFGHCDHPAPPSYTFTGNLKPCKVYYIWVTGCELDVCDFTFNTSGGGSPVLDPLDFINNEPSGIIEPVCVGACNVKFFVNTPGTCIPVYFVWTLDGKEVGGHSNKIQLDFPLEGDFILCVTGYLHDPKTGPNCASSNQICTLVKVRPLDDVIGEPRTICFEAAKPDGFLWYGQKIYNSGIYRAHFRHPDCCKYDSVIQFTVLPVPKKPDVYYITCSDEPYVDILGHAYTPCKDHYEISLPKSSDPFLCDSAIKLTAVSVDFAPAWKARCVGGQVEISAHMNVIQPCNVGETYKFEYNWYKKNDLAKLTIGTNERLLVDAINEDYCVDVNAKVHLGNTDALCTKTFCDSINEAEFKGSSSNISLHSCDSLKVNGQTYTESALFTQYLNNVIGCDSIIITDLNISKSSTSILTMKGCDSAIINNQLYYQSGNYSQKFINSNNCDSILNIDLTIGKTDTIGLKMSSCDSIVVNGKIYFKSGVYPELYQNAGLCDSFVNLDLTIYKTQRDSLSFSDCDTVFYNGKIYTKTGDYPEFHKNVNGCDSMVNIHINITSSNTSPLKLNKCDSVTINGTFYDQSGIYTQKLKSVNGCDSTLNIGLTIGKLSSFNYKLTSCDSILINKKWYYQSGNYTQILQNSSQCDSILNIDLNLKKATRGDTLFRSCDSVIINGITYRQTGIYKQTLVNSIQCDSILIIDFTRLSKNSTNLKYKSCDSISINGKVYSQSGLYSQILSNANQCDSLINLDVTITKSNSKDSVARGCDSLAFNGRTYYQTGIYQQDFTNTVFCDSVLFLNLTIYKSASVNYAMKACDSVFINHKWFYQSGSYTQYLKDVHQCDSTLNIQLTLNQSKSGNLLENTCDSLEINNIWYFVSGQYKQNLLTTNGCDSALTLDITIKPGNPTKLEAGPDTSICYGEILKLNGKFLGQANFFWHSTFGNFDSPDNLITNYYPTRIGDERIYLQAADDCKQWVDSLAVHILPRQIVQVTGDSILNPCKENSFTASGGTNYIWTPSSYIECLDPPCSRVILKSTAATRFTISTDGPCAEPTTLNLSIAKIQTDIYLPNVFSPNGDNINDVFLPVFNCEQVDFYDLQIFDRWGNLLFESQNKDKGWDGKYQDLKMNPGVYPYVVQYQVHGSERKVKAGDVTLIK